LIQGARQDASGENGKALCRPPIAIERLKLLSDGGLLYRLKKQWRDGTSHIIFQPLELRHGLPR
jgi:hypothetical protein